MKNVAHNHRKQIAGAILITLAAQTAGILLFPSPAAAVDKVQVDVQSGVIDDSRTEAKHEMIKAAGIALMNSALKSMTNKFNDTLEKKLGVKSFLLYQDSLIQAKYLGDAIQKKNGDEALARSGDILETVSRFENLPMNKSMTGKAIEDLAIKALQQPDGKIGGLTREQYAQKLIAGASLMFTSSIACGGINRKALGNTAQFLATLSSGVTPYDVNPADGLGFYRQMGALGAPTADPSFWQMALQQAGTDSEAQARQAAILEMMAPGLKSTQARDPQTGRIVTQNSLNLISVGQGNSQNSIYNIALKGTETVYDTSSFKGFITSAIKIKVGDAVASLMSNLLKKIPVVGGFLSMGFKEFQDNISNFAGLLAVSITQKYAEGLYNDVSKKIFNGQILGEFTGCPSKKSVAGSNTTFSSYFLPQDQFTSADRNFRASQFEVDESGTVAPAAASADFTASPGEIAPGETATLYWDASWIEGTTAVNITGGGLSGSREVRGELEITPEVDTTYTLTALNAQGGTIGSNTLTVKIRQLEGSASFSAAPAQVEQGRKAAFSWDVSEISDEDDVTIQAFTPSAEAAAEAGEPVLEGGSAVQDKFCYQTPIAEQTKFKLATPNKIGTVTEKELTITPVQPAAPRRVTMASDKIKIRPAESANIGWNVEGWPAAAFTLNGESVGRNDDRSVSLNATTTFTLLVAEENQCPGTLDQAEVTVFVGKNPNNLSGTGFTSSLPGQ